MRRIGYPQIRERLPVEADVGGRSLRSVYHPALEAQRVLSMCSVGSYITTVRDWLAGRCKTRCGTLISTRERVHKLISMPLSHGSDR
jgi:hypothetical protein